MRHFFQIRAENGNPKYKLEPILDYIKDVAKAVKDGDICLLLLPLKQYQAIQRLAKAARKWRDVQTNLVEKPTFGYENIAKENHLKLWQTITEIDEVDLFR